VTSAAGRGLVIFDIDGTLFRTETATIPAVQSAFREFRLPSPSIEEVSAFFGRPDAEFHAWLEERASPDTAAELANAIAARELEMVRRVGELYPGISEALDELRREVAQLAICSNGPEVYVRTVLEAKQLRGFFDAVRWREDADSTKSGMIRDVLRRLGARPAVLIGDRRDDVEAARSNGVFSIGAAYGYGRAGELDEADALVGAPAELAEVVRRVLSRHSPR